MEPVVPEDFRALLHGPLRWFYAATMVTSVGIGLSFVLNVIYVHDIRHHSIAFATGLLAANAIVGLVASPVIGTSVFAVGETLWSPVGPALINDIAPEHLRGRYNAAFGLTWGVSNALAPLLAGLLLGSAHARLWPYIVAVGAVAGGAVLVSLRLQLTPEEDGRTNPRGQRR